MAALVDLPAPTDSTVAREAQALLPVPSGERVVALDILRGLALAGMFIVHFHDRSTEPGASTTSCAR